jgi:hypothetical protein
MKDTISVADPNPASLSEAEPDLTLCIVVSRTDLDLFFIHGDPDPHQSYSNATTLAYKHSIASPNSN